MAWSLKVSVGEISYKEAYGDCRPHHYAASVAASCWPHQLLHSWVGAASALVWLSSPGESRDETVVWQQQLLEATVQRWYLQAGESFIL